MLARSFTFAVVMIATGLGAQAAQAPTPAPPAPATQSGRGRTTPPAPGSARPAQPAPQPGDFAGAEAPPTPPPAPPPPSTNPVPRRENQSTNIKIDVTITDQRANAAAITKNVSLVTGDGLSGSVRSNTSYVGGPGGGVPFNVDAMPTILADGKVHIRLTLQYDVPPPSGSGASPPQEFRLLQTSLRDSVTLILENNKPLVAIQSTDPVSDRKVSVEVKATILK